MQIILVITNSKGKSIIFVTQELKAYSIKEICKLIEGKLIENMHIVNSNSGI